MEARRLDCSLREAGSLDARAALPQSFHEPWDYGCDEGGYNACDYKDGGSVGAVVLYVRVDALLVAGVAVAHGLDLFAEGAHSLCDED